MRLLKLETIHLKLLCRENSKFQLQECSIDVQASSTEKQGFKVSQFLSNHLLEILSPKSITEVKR